MVLSLGKHVENFVGPRPGGDKGEIRKVEIRVELDAYEVWALDYEDIIEFDIGDIDELLPLDYDKDRPDGVFKELQDAIEFAEGELGARSGCWTNPGVCNGDYQDYIEAGRPDRWPSA